MQKLFVVLLALCTAGITQAQESGETSGAEEKPQQEAPPKEAEASVAPPRAARPMRPVNVTLEQYITRQQRAAERSGEEFNQAATEAKFKELDQNKDGVLSGNELPRPAREPFTKERFIERQKRMAERRGQEFDQAAAEAEFVTLDKNKDGVLTGDEMPMRRRAGRGAGGAQGQANNAPETPPAEAVPAEAVPAEAPPAEAPEQAPQE